MGNAARAADLADFQDNGLSPPWRDSYSSSLPQVDIEILGMQTLQPGTSLIGGLIPGLLSFGPELAAAITPTGVVVEGQGVGVGRRPDPQRLAESGLSRRLSARHWAHRDWIRDGCGNPWRRFGLTCALFGSD